MCRTGPIAHRTRINKENVIFNILIIIYLSMAHVEVSKLAPQELAELACTYAALILHDDGQDITGTPYGTQVKRSASWWLHLA